jgi:hypothetical protein
MLVYFLIFTLLGFLIQRNFADKSAIIIISLAVIWGLSSAPIWGLASLGEMFLGKYIAQEM